MIKIITTKEYTDLSAAREKLQHVEWTAAEGMEQARHYYEQRQELAEMLGKSRAYTKTIIASNNKLLEKLQNANKQLTGAYNTVNDLKYENEQATICIEQLTEENIELRERFAEFAHQLGYDLDAEDL